jgi:cytochrome c5
VSRGAGVTVAAAALIAGALAACHPPPPPVTPARTEWARAKWPDITQAELERGRALFGARCSACHLAPVPTDRKPDEWPGEVAEMAERARLTVDERLAIERYLVTVASTK